MAEPTWEQEAAKIRTLCNTDEIFVSLVNDFVESWVSYVTNGGWEVKSPSRSYAERTGDCSERALLKVAMLTSQKINANVVWGFVNNDMKMMHDTVEVHLGKYPYIINPWERNCFHKAGDGMHPQEIVIP